MFHHPLPDDATVSREIYKFQQPLALFSWRIFIFKLIISLRYLIDKILLPRSEALIEGHAINLETLYEITNGRNVIITRPFIEFIASFHYSIRVSRVAKALATFLIMNDRSIDLNLKSIVTEREIKKIKNIIWKKKLVNLELYPKNRFLEIENRGRNKI